MSLIGGETVNHTLAKGVDARESSGGGRSELKRDFDILWGAV